MTRLALVSPNSAAISETFIQAHRTLLHAEVSYYYGGYLPTALDGKGVLRPTVLEWLLAGRRACCDRAARIELSQRALSASFRQRGIQVVLAEFGPTAVAVLPICRQLEVPLIAHFHGFDASEKSVVATNASAYRELFAYASAVVAVSRSMERALIDLGCPSQKLVYNPYGPHENFFSIRPRSSREGRLVTVGRLVDKKAPHYLLFAFSTLAARHPQATLTVIGDGPLRGVCEDLVDLLALRDRVRFRGNVDHEGVNALFEESSIYVQHSVIARSGDSEGTPVAVLEAMAAGLPIVATRHAGIADVIEAPTSGRLVEERDVAGMVTEVSELIENPDAAARMGEAARQRIRERFSMARHISALDDLIQSAVRANATFRPRVPGSTPT